MLCKYSCKFNHILANSFSHLNHFPNLNLLLVNITNTANGSDVVKRTALLCSVQLPIHENVCPVKPNSCYMSLLALLAIPLN